MERIFTVDDPRTLDGVLSIVPGEAPVPEMEFSYDISPPKGSIRDESTMATCVHCRHPNHWHGFVMRFPDGSRILVGKDCGFKLYGAEFNEKHRSFKSARATSLRLSRIRTIDAQVDKSLGELWALAQAPALIAVLTVRKQLRDRMPALARALGAVATSGGMLSYEVQVDDVIGQLRDESLEEDPDQKKAETDGEKKKPRTRTETRNHGSLKGAMLFRTEQSPASVIEEQQAKLRAFWRPDRKSGTPTPLEKAEIKTLSETKAGTLVADTRRAVEVAEEMIGLGHALAAFFERDNLVRIVRWTRDRPDLRGRYALTTQGGIAWENEDTGTKVAVVRPKDLLVPPSPGLERLKRALVSGY